MKNLSKLKVSVILIVLLTVISCSKGDQVIDNEIDDAVIHVANTIKLPQRPGDRPKTSPTVPHVQFDVKVVPEVNEKLLERVYSIPGIDRRPSDIVSSYQSLWLTNEVTIVVPDALLIGREFGHIHGDGSLHIFLEPSRAKEAVESGWATFHPFAVGETGALSGFVMLYTPQSLDELNITFLLIVDAYNYVTGQGRIATDFY